MGKINVLSFAVANLIAAGEVVDRPASVIKELLENAIDSGADRITVEIQHGGVTYMRVADNGCGMEPEDLPVAIRRHATSKIKDAEDLEGIITLGFRGEALAAIASVSRMRIISKTRDADTGAMLEAVGGDIVGVSERACSDGTTVIVEDLFANVPARRKFLKKDVTESMAVSGVVEKIALSKPNIAFRLIIDGNLKLETLGDGNLKNAVYSIFGRDFASKLIQTEIEIDGIAVKGFVGRSDNVRSNRNYQNFFINGRYVKSKTACAAIEQAYTSHIPPEKFPSCILFITINPSAVDVNVHPAKLEVKFSNEKPVFDAVFYAAKNAIESNTARPEVVLAQPQKRNTSFAGSGWNTQTLSESELSVEARREGVSSRQIRSELFIQKEQYQEAKEAREVKENTAPAAPAVDMPKVQESKISDSSIEISMDDPIEVVCDKYLKRIMLGLCGSVPNDPCDMADDALECEDVLYDEQPEGVDNSTKTDINTKIEEVAATADRQVEKTENEIKPSSLKYKILGEVFNSYVVVEREDSMLIIDKHAAHERIIFEGLKASLKNTDTLSQMLMLPIEVMLTSEEIQTIVDYKNEIESVGFEFTTGRYTANVTAIPEGIDASAVPDMIAVIAERLKSNTGSAKLTRDIVFEKALYQASCKAAIKAGREYPKEHIDWLVAKLMELPDITVCPHGRPVAMELSKKNLDRQFERT